MFHAHEYELVVSVQIVVHVLAPAGERWLTKLVTPETSEAVAPTVTVPRRGEPGSVTATAGPLLSTIRAATLADAVVSVEKSVATVRSS